MANVSTTNKTPLLPKCMPQSGTSSKSSQPVSGWVFVRPDGTVQTSQTPPTPLLQQLTTDVKDKLGSYKNESSSVNGGNKTQSADKSSSDGSKELVAVLATAQPQDLQILTTLMAKHAIGHGRLGTKLKAYRFASDDRVAYPWKLYSSYNKWAPLGLNGTIGSGTGWQLTGVSSSSGCPLVSNDIGVSLDNIPLNNPASNVMARSGASIYVKKIVGNFKVKRVQIWPGDASLGTTRNMILSHNNPHVISFIERTPIAYSGDVDPNTNSYNVGLMSVCATALYPAEFTSSGTLLANPMSANFLAYVTASQSPVPYLDNGAGAPGTTTWHVPNDNAESEVCAETHRSTTCVSELYSLYKRTHAIHGTSQTSVTTTAASATGVRTMAAHWTVPPAEEFTIPHNHTFNGKGLRVMYADAGTGTFSIASINQLRAKYWQESTGTYWTTASATAVPTRIDTAGFSEQIAYEFFVEYEDCNDE